MRNIFLDLGTHFGQGLNEFIQKFNMNDSWIIHTFEANPHTFEKFSNEYHSNTPWVIAHNKAVSNKNGFITVNLESFPNGDKNGMGSSVVDIDNWNPWKEDNKQHFQYQVEVESIDFSKFIIDNFEKSDNIVVKMDIEGSEYDTLDKMIEDGSIEYINDLTIEWHAHYFNNQEEIQKRQNELIEKLKTYNMNLKLWK